MAIIDITGLDQVEVFRRLYNRARPQGMGFLHFEPEDMTYEQAQQEYSPDVDYHRGRVMKVTIRSRQVEVQKLSRINYSDSEIAERVPAEGVEYYFDGWLYDRDNGEGAAAEVVNRLRAEVTA